MPIKRDVKAGGSRFGRPPGTPQREITPQQREDELVNALRILLRKLARHLGVPRDQINTKVTRMLRRLREEVRGEFRS